MDYIKIGNFISQKRKNKNLTQKELAEKIGVTDKAVSKWERGLGCPDVSLLEVLAKNLDCSILDILNGGTNEGENLNIEKSEKIAQKIINYSQKQISYWKNIISKTLIGIILSIAGLLIVVNIVNISELNKKENYDYISTCGDINYFDNLVFEIKNNISIIQKNRGDYSNDDYIYIIDELNKLNTKMSNLTIFKYAKENKKISLKDLFVFYNDMSNNEIGMNVFFKLYKYDNNIIIKQTNLIGHLDALRNILINDNYMNIARSYSYEFSKFNIIPEVWYGDMNNISYSIKYNKDNDILGNMDKCMCIYRYDLEFYKYLTDMIIEVGGINE